MGHIIHAITHPIKEVLKSPVFKPVADAAALATGNPELIPAINGGTDLVSGKGIGSSLEDAGLSFAGQEVGSALGNEFPDTFGSTFGTSGNSLTDLFGDTSNAGSLAGDGTLGGDISSLFSSPNAGTFNGIAGTATSDPTISGARDAVSGAATTGAASPAAGVTSGTGLSSVGGGSTGGFVNAPDVSSDLTQNISNTGGFANAPDISSDLGGASSSPSADPFSQPDLSSQFTLPNTGTSPFETAASAAPSGGSSVNYGNLVNGAGRSLLTGLLANTNQKGYQGENAAAQQAAAAYQPFLANGTQASNTLSSLYGDNGADAAAAAQQGFQNTPGYQFARDQGISALDASAASRGQLLSGNQNKAVQDYGTGLANQTYQQYVGNLQNQAGVGANAANGYGSAIVGGANALAQGGQASANNQNQTVGGIANALFPGNDILSILRGNTGNNGVLSSLFQ